MTSPGYTNDPTIGPVVAAIAAPAGWWLDWHSTETSTTPDDSWPLIGWAIHADGTPLPLALNPARGEVEEVDLSEPNDDQALVRIRMIGNQP